MKKNNDVTKNYTYYNPRRIVDEGDVVITTRNPSDLFYRTCASVDRNEYVLAGVLVKGSAELCSMDVTKREDLEAFVNAVSSCFFFFPAAGIIYKLPIRKAKELVDNYKQVRMDADKVRDVLDRAGIELTGGIMTSMSFSPRGEL